MADMTDYSSSRVIPVSEDISDHVIVDLVDVSFHSYHDQPFSFSHGVKVRERLSRRLLANYLVLAFFATAL